MRENPNEALTEVIHKIDELSWELARLKANMVRLPEIEGDLAALRRVKDLLDGDAPSPETQDAEAAKVPG
jgi:hypothetical protein